MNPSSDRGSAQSQASAKIARPAKGWKRKIWKVIKVSVVCLVLLFIVVFGVAACRARKLIGSVPDTYVRLTGTCRLFSVELKHEAEFSLRLRNSGFEQLIVHNSDAVWRGPVSVQGGDTTTWRDVALLRAVREIDGDTLLLRGGIPTRMDFSLPKNERVTVASRSAGKSRQIGFAPFRKGLLLALTSRHKQGDGPAMIIDPSDVTMQYRLPSTPKGIVNNFPRNVSLNIRPGPAAHPGEPIQVDFQPAANDGGRLETLWNGTQIKVDFRKTTMLFDRLELPDLHLSEMAVAGEDRLGEYSSRRTHLRLKAPQSMSNATVTIEALGPAGIKIQVQGIVSKLELAETEKDILPSRWEQLLSAPVNSDNWLDKVFVVWWLKEFSGKVVWAAMGAAIMVVFGWLRQWLARKPSENNHVSESKSSGI